MYNASNWPQQQALSVLLPTTRWRERSRQAGPCGGFVVGLEHVVTTVGQHVSGPWLKNIHFCYMVHIAMHIATRCLNLPEQLGLISKP